MYEEQRDRVLAQAEAKANLVRATARVCAVCGKSMLNWPNRTVHFSCDPELPLAGTACVCAPGCSGTHWGNGPVECDPACVPCRRMRLQPLRDRKDRR
jgi:hypothetical protein